MNTIVRKLLKNCITLFIVTVFITILVSIPQDFHFNYSTRDILNQVYNNLNDVRLSVTGLKKYNGISIQVIIFESFIRSYKLILTAFFISIAAGVIKGVTDFNIRKQDTSAYRLMNTLFMLSIPDILIIIIFRISIRYFEKKLGIEILPIVGYKTAAHLILPAITLSIVPIVYIARSTTTALKQVYKKPFMIVAKGKGISSRMILFKHGLRNCFNTIFDASLGVFNIIMSSLLVVEIFFYYPGVTMQMFEFYQKGQAHMFIIYAFFLGSIFVLINLFISLLKLYFDPERRGESFAKN